MPKIDVLPVKGLGKCAVALCGALDVKGPFLTHLKENGLGEQLEASLGRDEEGSLDMRGLVVTGEGDCYEITTSGGYFLATPPVTIGSGSWIAQHFLYTGHDALTAVQEACKTELTCGGDITVFDLATRKFETIKG